MATKPKQIIAIDAPVSIEAAMSDEEKKMPRKFTAEFYTGGALELEGWDYPVVVDLAGLETSNVLVANLDHDRTKRVGNFAVANDGKSLVANGTASARTAARDEVVGSAEDGYQWQASLEVRPQQIEEVKKGHQVEVNGQSFTGPLYVTRKGTLKGFAFVSHGADDNTSATIAATAASTKEKNMDPEFKKWVEAMGFDADDLTETQRNSLEANYLGQSKSGKKKTKLSEGLDAKAQEVERVDSITEIALKACDARPYDIDAIRKLADDAIEGKWSVDKFRLELLEAAVPMGTNLHIRQRPDKSLSNRVIEAAICQAGRLQDIDKKFSDQELQLAHDKFRGNIGLKQLILLAAESNGYRSSYSQDVTIEAQRAAFRMKSPHEIHATGFSTIDIDSIIANTANKFVMQGWMSVDQTPLRFAAIRNVRDFKTVTTVSLTGSLDFEKVSGAGEIKHGTVGELTYTYSADTYARMLAITRQDIINDDLAALTDVPSRLGRGAMLKLNDIFWTAWLGAEASGFFAAGNNNLNTAVADVTVGGLDATNTIFANQTDPDGKPLALSAKYMLVPTAQHGAALRLMNSELLIDGTSTALGGSTNVWKGRFEVLTSPYMSNSSYTGNSSVAWYLIADPAVLPAIVIAALNGRVEPTVETADADFNVLGIQMRGYSDVGVALFEKRAAVKADGGSS